MYIQYIVYVLPIVVLLRLTFYTRILYVKRHNHFVINFETLLFAFNKIWVVLKISRNKTRRTKGPTLRACRHSQGHKERTRPVDNPEHNWTIINKKCSKHCYGWFFCILYEICYPNRFVLSRHYRAQWQLIFSFFYKSILIALFFHDWNTTNNNSIMTECLTTIKRSLCDIFLTDEIERGRDGLCIIFILQVVFRYWKLFSSVYGIICNTIL